MMILGWAVACSSGPATAPPPDDPGWSPPDDPLARVHLEALEAWSVARSEAEREQAAARARVDVPPELRPALDELLATGDPTGWNAALAEAGLPWAVSGGSFQGRPYAKAYAVVGRPRATVDGEGVTVAVGLRVDRLNVVEGYLGLSGHAGEPLVIVDRAVDWVAEEVWPRLDPAVDDPFAEPIRAWAAGIDGIEPLRSTAAARRALLEARRAIAGRESCGSTFGLRFGWSGLSELGQLDAYAASFAGAPCPGVTRAEAAQIREATMQIRTTPGVGAALRRVVARALAPVVIHEARHALDRADPALALRTGDPVAAEGSAWLSGLAYDEGPLTWMQACGALPEGGATGLALTELLQALGVDCAHRPPDLQERARRHAAAGYGRSDAWILDGAPESVPLERASPPR